MGRTQSKLLNASSQALDRERRKVYPTLCRGTLWSSLMWYFSNSKIWGSSQGTDPTACESETICTHRMTRQQTLGCLKHADVLGTDEAWSRLFRNHLTSLIQHGIGSSDSCKENKDYTAYGGLSSCAFERDWFYWAWQQEHYDQTDWNFSYLAF